MQDLLASAGLPTRSLGDRLADLPERCRRLHGALLGAFVSKGAAWDLPGVMTSMGQHSSDAATLLAQLADANLVALGEDGLLVGVFPFSNRSTRHRVEIGGGSIVWAMCAIDALAIAAMIRRDITIKSTDPVTGRSISVTVRGREVSWEPDTAMVLLGRLGDGPIALACCAHIDFYADMATATQASKAKNGIVLPIPDALELGNAVFADLAVGDA